MDAPCGPSNGAAESDAAPSRRGGAVGFWLGLAAFVFLAAWPVPDSMRQVARERFAEQAHRDTSHVLAQQGRAGAPPDSADYASAEQVAIDAAARRMMRAAAVTVLVACWWISVALPIPVTSLIPLVLFPVMGVMPIGRTAAPYANANVFLFMGGFIIALAIEKWGLHRRIALKIVLWVGTSRSTLVLGFMIASALLSMWISNTATTMMMLPIALAVVRAVSGRANAEFGMRNAESGTEPPSPIFIPDSEFRIPHSGDSAFARPESLGPALMLGIAYAASIGGIGTPIGTPPNIAFYGQYRTLFPEAAEIGFGQWVLTFFPLVAVFVPVTWFVLTRITCRVGRGRAAGGRESIRRELATLGGMRGAERRVLVVFVVTALLWMLRSIPIGADANYGWSYLLERAVAPAGGALSAFRASWIDDATIAVAMAILLFIIPAGGLATGAEAKTERQVSACANPAAPRDVRKRAKLMDWETAVRLPWGILLLFGGGFAIAEAFESSGLSHWCGRVFSGLGITNPVLLVLGVCLLITFLTEITSNTATTQIMLPIVAKVSTALHVHPLLLMLPATISASCAFMLPVATPPNAIVFGSGHVQMRQMVRTGLILNLVGAALITALTFWVVGPVMGIKAGP